MKARWIAAIALGVLALPVLAQIGGGRPAPESAAARSAREQAERDMQAAVAAVAKAADEAAREADKVSAADTTANLVDAGDNMAVYGGSENVADNDMMMDDNMAMDATMTTMDANMSMDPPAPRTHRRGARRRR